MAARTPCRWTAGRPRHLGCRQRRVYVSDHSDKWWRRFRATGYIWDEFHAYRVIPLDGRPHVGPNVKLWMGDARGHWEGNTVVIDTTNVRGARLTYIGDFYSDNAHIIERFTFVDGDTMDYEATVDDPTVFTRP